MKISWPASVTPMVCSNWAESERSLVTAVQPSRSSFTCQPPRLIIGSTVKNMPGRKVGPGAGLAVVQHVRRVVEDAPDAVAAEVAYHGAALALGVALDRVADIAEPRAGPDLGDAAHHGLVGDVDEPARLHARRARVEHAARVAVPAVEDHGHVDVHDVALLQPLVAGDAVADDVIDRGADGLGVAAIAERRRHCAAIDDVVVAEGIEGLGGDAGLDQRRQRVEHLGREPAGLAHRRERVRTVGLDAPLDDLRAATRGHGWPRSLIRFRRRARPATGPARRAQSSRYRPTFNRGGADLFSLSSPSRRKAR